MGYIGAKQNQPRWDPDFWAYGYAIIQATLDFTPALRNKNSLLVGGFNPSKKN